jgi:CxxC-x17-CxxC domain-containing protein
MLSILRIHSITKIYMPFGKKQKSYSKKSYDGGDGRKKVMYDANCSTCGDHCKVPFRPIGDKPVLCSTCFEQKGGKETHDAERRFEANNRDISQDRRPLIEPPRTDSQIASLKGELRTMHSKLDRLIQMLGDK